MVNRRIVCKSLPLLLIVFLLTGCWDREELEDRSYVIALGLDRSKVEGKVKVTMLIANPEVGSMQGGGGSEEKARGVISFDANDFLTAKGTANAVISRTISYDLLKIIVVSEEFAKDPAFIDTMYDIFKDKEIRLDSYLAVSKEKTHKYLLNNKPRMETRPHKYFQFMIDHGLDNGLIPDSTLFRFFKTVEGGNDLFLAMYTSTVREKEPEIKGEDEYIAGELNVSADVDDTQFIGSAVFKNGRMIAKLSGQETRIVNTLDDTTNIDAFSISTPNFFDREHKHMSFRLLKEASNKVKMNFHTPKPKIEITIPFSIDVLSNPSMVDFKDEKNKQKLKKDLTELLSSRMEDVIKTAQKELKGAPYPLSLYARKHFLTVKEFDEFNWTEKFVEADIKIKADVQILDYGKTTSKRIKMGG